MSRWVMITGERGSLGQVLAAKFADAGWGVVAANRAGNDKRLRSVNVASDLELDLRADAQVEEATRTFFDLPEDGDHAALVANASNRGALSLDWDGLTRQTLHALFDVDVAGHLFLARAFAREASLRGCSATILFVGSIYGSGGVHSSIYPEGMQPAPLQYSVIKAALVGLTRDLAGRLGRTGVTVNCLVPGGIKSEQPDSFVRAFSSLTQLGRMADSAEVAAVAEMLCREDCSYVTGQVIHVDGGWSAW